ncbi:MAG: hypothetical protein HYR91_09745 [Flavobacteriia bacterium]|nr:hypothetical protein [Flavobacteriia bacterium]
MSLRKIFKLYRTMEQEDIILSFNGIVTADFLASVLHLMETKMQTLDESSKRKKKVFNVLVECIQNLYHHIDDDDLLKANLGGKNPRTALIMVLKNEEGFLIQTGNYIEKELALELEAKLIKINSLGKEELREYYQTILSNGAVSEKGTAGLGMIDIARKSGNKLEYEFLDVDENYCFFSLNVKID